MTAQSETTKPRILCVKIIQNFIDFERRKIKYIYCFSVIVRVRQKGKYLALCFNTSAWQQARRIRSPALGFFCFYRKRTTALP